MHELWAVGLGKDIGADCMAGLILSKLTEQGNDFRIDIYRPYLATLGSVQIDTLLRGIAQISSYRNRVCLEVNVLPPQAAALTPPDAGVDEQSKQDTPFEWFALQSGKDPLDFFDGVGFHICIFELIIAELRPLDLIHWVDRDHVGHVRHFEQAVQDSIDFDTGGVGLALRLHGQEQSGDVGWGDIGHF